MKASKVILAQAGFRVGLAILALAAVPARADVLEIGAEGAHWVAGGPLEFGAAADAPTPEVVIPDQISQAATFVHVSAAEASARGVPPQFAGKVAELAARYDLSPALIEALVWQESRWHAGALSPKGARGLAQLMPGTARYLGVDANDPYANLEGGARYLREQLNRFDGDLEKALAAYNAGPGRVERAGGVPRIRETQQYVVAIMGRLANHSSKETQ